MGKIGFPQTEKTRLALRYRLGRTWRSSWFVASCCDPRYKNGRIRVGPTFVTGKHGWENEPRRAPPPPDAPIPPRRPLSSQSSGNVAWNPKNPPDKGRTFLDKNSHTRPWNFRFEIPLRSETERNTPTSLARRTWRKESTETDSRPDEDWS